MKKRSLFALSAVLLLPGCCCWKKKACKKEAVTSETVITHTTEVVERESGPMQDGIEFADEDLK